MTVDSRIDPEQAARVFGAVEEAPRRPRRDDCVELKIDGIDARGHGVGRVGPYRFKLRRCLPGDRVLARVARRRRFEIDAHALEILEPSPDRVAPRCPHVADCGGCSFQELSYERQRSEKRELARRLLETLELADVPEVQGPTRIDRYRNKMDFTFGDQRWTESEDDGRALDFALGLHSPRRYEKVLDVKRCILQPEWGDAALASARELALAHGLTPWSVERHVGCLRHLVLRTGFHTDECMAYLVTSSALEPGFDDFVRAWLARHPEVTTLIHGVTDRLATVAICEDLQVLHGPGYIHEQLCGLQFRVSAPSFFQTNTEQAEALIETARRFLGRAGATGGVLFDLYCGAGTFALCLARSFETVVGLELVDAAVVDAERNARANGIENARFHAGDVLAMLEPSKRAELGLPNPDAVIVDPPRAGLHAGVIEALLELAPETIVYVSCNLAAAARDLAVLSAETYRVVDLALVDLFPHTPHLEGVFLLARGD